MILYAWETFTVQITYIVVQNVGEVYIDSTNKAIRG